MWADNKLIVVCPGEDGGIHETHPHCPHGPALLFYRKSTGIENGFYACAAYRDRKVCNFHLPAKDVNAVRLAHRFDIASHFYKELRLDLKEAFKGGAYSCFNYCHNCELPYLNRGDDSHKTHTAQRNLKAIQYERPVEFLPPAIDERGQAQYFFDAKSLTFFTKCFVDLGTNKIVCIGAPMLHNYIRQYCPQLKSFLLDIDIRFMYFLEDSEFAWYNMCNDYFFVEQQKQSFRKFLKCGKDEQVMLFTDPPFACRTETIAYALRSLTAMHNQINGLTHRPLPIFWVFPYYSEHNVRQQMGALEMCDYKVNYTNHVSYTDVGPKCRKMGSPVRLYTNVPLERIQLPVHHEYKYCDKCNRYTALENRHCNKCGQCTSKNGTTYRHCQYCARCVKSNYFHCMHCRRCAQHEGHNCVDYQKVQHCWICLRPGHIERHCVEWLKHCKRINHLEPLNAVEYTDNWVCMLCGEWRHNERVCPQRKKYIQETTFMGEVSSTFL